MSKIEVIHQGGGKVVADNSQGDKEMSAIEKKYRAKVEANNKAMNALNGEWLRAKTPAEYEAVNRKSRKLSAEFNSLMEQRMKETAAVFKKYPIGSKSGDADENVTKGRKEQDEIAKLSAKLANVTGWISTDVRRKLVEAGKELGVVRNKVRLNPYAPQATSNELKAANQLLLQLDSDLIQAQKLADKLHRQVVRAKRSY